MSLKKNLQIEVIPIPLTLIKALIIAGLKKSIDF